MSEKDFWPMAWSGLGNSLTHGSMVIKPKRWPLVMRWIYQAVLWIGLVVVALGLLQRDWGAERNLNGSSVTSPAAETEHFIPSSAAPMGD